VDWERLAGTVRLAVRFLDDVIDVSRHPFPELEHAALATRKVGLGIMGLAELLATLGIAHDSVAAVRLAGRLASPSASTPATRPWNWPPPAVPSPPSRTASSPAPGHRHGATRR
jgi:ribonucleoside-diphosphate reductase alpha chain